MLLPLLILLGVVVDGGLGMLSQRKLQNAVEAAAQAGVLSGTQDLTKVTTAVQGIYITNTGSLKGISVPTVRIGGNILTVSATIIVPTTFMQLGGVHSVTYTATASIPFIPPTEVAIAMDASLASSSNGFLRNSSTGLISFLNNLPALSMVSVAPFATEIRFDPATTISSALPINLSSQASDERATPAFFAISPNYTWNLQSYNSVYNYFYGAAFPILTTYYPLSGTCPGGYSSCNILYPAYCSVGKQSCSSRYTYVQSNMIGILPLTANSTILTSYLQNLANFTGGSNGFWGSLMVWGWRTIAPEWTYFFQTNSGATDTVRTTGTFPAAYGSATKHLVLMVYGNNYWSDPATIGQYFTARCGSAIPQQKWKMTAYGVFPLTTDYVGTANDGTCDNYNYGLIDSFFGLNLSSGDFL
ncbi:MAG: pilus assembly protein TadG-related protein, partial [Bacteroidota bacterium]